jgi:hypothetical protein
MQSIVERKSKKIPKVSRENTTLYRTELVFGLLRVKAFKKLLARRSQMER